MDEKLSSDAMRRISHRCSAIARQMAAIDPAGAVVLEGKAKALLSEALERENAELKLLERANTKVKPLKRGPPSMSPSPDANTGHRRRGD
jgi:hypothetical protein